MHATGRQPNPAIRAPDGTLLHYERHRPEQTTLYRLVQQHAASFTAHIEASTGGELPRSIKDEFDAFLECGILACGFLRLRCGECGHDKLLAFSCKRRGFCPSCGARRMSQTAAFLTYRITVSGDLGIDGMSSRDRGWSTTVRGSFTSSVGMAPTHRSLQANWMPESRRLVGDGAFSTLLPLTLSGTASVGVDLSTTPYEPSSAQFRTFTDLGHTIGWGGILSLRTTDGALIENYSAIGDSGFDYRPA